MHYALCPAWRHPCVDTYAVKGQLGVESRRVSADTLGTEQCSEAETVAEDRAVEGRGMTECRTGARQQVCSAVLMLVLKMVLFVNHWLNTKHWGQIFHQPIFY